jgi:glycosyltransferase involved in cell wall biosynthesis
MHVMHIFGNFGPGGAEMGVVRLIKAFPKGNIEHSVCSIGSNVGMKELLPEEVNCYSLGIDGACYTAFITLYRLLKQTNSDIAHVNNLSPWFDVALASKLAGCKCIETFHGIEENITTLPPRRRLLTKIASLLTTSITSVAESAANLLAQLTKIKKNRVTVLPNAVDTDLFCPCPSSEIKTELRKSFDLPEKGLLMGCVAALRPVKDHQGLIRAFARAVSDKEVMVSNSDIYLVLVGEGPLKNHLKLLSQALGIEAQVIFLGRQNDIHKVLQAFDVFVLNSKTEGMSYAILEAMATRLPVIATDVGANSELIRHDLEGYLVPQGETETMARHITLLINNRSRLRAMGNNARYKIIKSYSFQKMISSYKTLYEEVSERRKQGGVTVKGNKRL